MYTIEGNYKEMVATAKGKGLETKNIKKVDLVEMLNAAEVVVETKVETRGRKIDPNSPRQQRLSLVGTIGRGRPSNPESAWNKRQAELTARREAGELKLGRAINPDSERQKRLALKGTLPLGRPKAVKEEIELIPLEEVVDKEVADMIEAVEGSIQETV